MSEAVDRLIAYCRENNRVCPLPKAWQQLREMMPEKKTGYRCLGTCGAANWSRMAWDAGDAQDGATCGAYSMGSEAQRTSRGCSDSAGSTGKWVAASGRV